MKCAHGIWKLAEVHLEEGGNRVDILENEAILEQVGYPVLVKGDSQSLNIGRNAGKTIDPVYDSLRFDESRTVFQHFGN